MFGKVVIPTVLVIAAIGILILGTRISYDIDEIVSDIPQEVTIGRLTTDTWGIFDTRTGEVLEGENTSEVRSIASITKLFTAYAIQKSEKIDTPIVIVWNDLYTEGRAGKLSHGERITPRELLFPLLIESSNDAGEAVRRNTGGEFFGTIDGVITDLNLENTNIADASGLSSQNQSTVEELASFYVFLKDEEPYILDITRLPMYITDDSGWVSNNPARDIDGYLGGKNGFTYEAGRTLLAAYTLSDGKERGIVLLGSSDIVSDVRTILTYLENS